MNCPRLLLWAIVLSFLILVPCVRAERIRFGKELSIVCPQDAWNEVTFESETLSRKFRKFEGALPKLEASYRKQLYGKTFADALVLLGPGYACASSLEPVYWFFSDGSLLALRSNFEPGKRIAIISGPIHSEYGEFQSEPPPAMYEFIAKTQYDRYRQDMLNKMETGKKR
ncbi:MAG: hypothetical protein J5J00_02085 [Deltaproteobacteria bacterium]|nr:hypothetical protein [Deltaproteobacteria bacterium]